MQILKVIIIYFMIEAMQDTANSEYTLRIVSFVRKRDSSVCAVNVTEFYLLSSSNLSLIAASCASRAAICCFSISVSCSFVKVGGITEDGIVADSPSPVGAAA